MWPLKRTGRCKAFLVISGRAAVTFGPPTRTVEVKLLSNLMKRVSKAPTKENQMKQERNTSEAERRAQFTEAAIVTYEWLTLLKSKKQSKSEQHPGNSSTISRKQLQATVQRHDNKLQELVDEVNTKRRLGQRIIADSDRPNKLKVLTLSTNCSLTRGRNTQAIAAS